MLTYGLPTGTDVTFEVVNGTGIGEANVFRQLRRRQLQERPAPRLPGGRPRPSGVGAFGYLGQGEAGRDRQRGLDGRRRRDGLGQAVRAQPPVRRAARQQPVFRRRPARREGRDPRRLRRAHLPPARGRQPLVRGRALQLGGFRPVRTSATPPRRPTTAISCGGTCA
ncbi:MAG: hypothetical protein MZV64_67855 [Ignavibacteriales bacterium]|nr:hypothetical protein [Ignavibacteriales bacterium]